LKKLFALGLLSFIYIYSSGQNNYTVLSDYVNSWPLDIVVGKRGGIQIFDQNQGQLYYPFLYPNSGWIFNSVYLSVGNHLISSNSFAINIEDEQWDGLNSTVSNVSGSGTVSDPWLITQQLRAQRDYGVDVHYYYINGDDHLVIYYEVICPEDNTEYIKLFHILDTYLGGTDSGPAYIEGTAPDLNIVGTVTSDRYIVFGNPDTQFSAYGSHNWYWILNEPVFGNDMQNILDFDDDTDNGVGVQWDLGVVTGKQTAIGTHMSFAQDIPLALPVEWLSFEAKNEEDHVNLEWITASEVNNDYFEVQRSIDGINWESREKVYGAGFSNALSYYSAKDENPLSGESYYRIKQIDFDGSIDYSEIDVVVRPAGAITTLFPNPGNGVFRFDFESKRSLDAFMQILDISGNFIYEEQIHFDKGLNVLFNNFISIPKGTYILQIEERNGEFKTQEIFVII